MAGLAALACVASARAQTPAPYAAIDPDKVSYNGPGRDVAHDLPGAEIKIGLIVPLQGPRQSEGRALRLAAQLAIEDESALPFPDHRGLALAIGDESGPWGRASGEIARLVFDERAVAVITSTEGGTAHLAEQIGNRIGVPILTLASDATTTQINLPWIFRLGPTDAAEARAFARDIYGQRRLSSVVLGAEDGHDGRVGGEEFEKAVRRFKAARPPARVAIPASLSDSNRVIGQILALRPQAVVLWTGPEAAEALLPSLHEALPEIPIYLCSKAAQNLSEAWTRERCRTCPDAGGDRVVWTVSPAQAPYAGRTAFEQKYRERAGSAPTAAAAEAYDAVRLLAAALRKAGPNRARLRDALETQPRFSGVAGPVVFDGAGNNQTDITLVPLP